MQRSETGPSVAIDPKWKRLLPSVKCPWCGNNLKELRIRGEFSAEITIAWVCDCKKFKEIEKIVNSYDYTRGKNE